MQRSEHVSGGRSSLATARATAFPLPLSAGLRELASRGSVEICRATGKCDKLIFAWAGRAPGRQVLWRCPTCRVVHDVRLLIESDIKPLGYDDANGVGVGG